MNDKLKPLQEFNEQSHNLADALPVPVYVVQDSVFQYVNQAFLDASGYAVEEVVGCMSVMDFLTEQSRPIVAEQIKKRLTGEAYSAHFECQGIAKSGQLLDLKVHGTVMSYQGKPATVGTLLNITERKQAEHILRESEERFRLAFHTSSDSININRLEDGIYVEINQGFSTITGYSREEVIGKSSIEINIWDNPQDRQRLVDGLKKEGRVENLEARFCLKDGTTVTGLMSASVITLNGKAHILSCTRNIEHLKQLEREREQLLHESEKSEAKLVSAQYIARMGNFTWDIQTGHVAWSRGMHHLLKYPEKEEIDYDKVNQAIHHPDDLLCVTQWLEKSIASGRKKLTPKEYRFVCKDGEVIWVETNGSISYEDGKAVTLFGTCHDITERKQFESALQKKEQKTRQIIETARDAFVSIDASGHITDWSPRAEAIFGWSTKEALGRLLDKTIIPEELRQAHKKGLQHYLATGEDSILNRHVELTALHHDGHTFPVELSIVADHSTGDTVFNAFIADISARQQRTTALQQSHEQVRSSLIGTVVAVSRAVGSRDAYTASHQQRVSRLARAIGQQLGLAAERIEGLRIGASIHDIGKIVLPAELLAKPTKLSDLEYQYIQTHAQAGYDILKDVKFPWPVAEIIYLHHERLDGSGYPQGLKGDEICLEARIVAIADVVEAMQSHRPYRPSLGIDAALAEIERYRGEKFDAAATDACLQLFLEQGFTLDQATA
ncbi:MAG TPA: PAS domain S-box protein [Gammaproteobacteria bacterium]|nr:PAS domain S-box protein [Gammaproteobacteria bacterium]